MNRVRVGNKMILDNGVNEIMEEVFDGIKIKNVLTGEEDVVSKEFLEWNGIFPEDTTKLSKSDILNF